VATAVKAKMIFAYMHEYESHFGDLSQVSRLEQRMCEFYPDDLGVRQFSLRFVTSAFDPTSVRPIISSQQTRPRIDFHPSIEASTSAVNSPQLKILDITAANSPKRPFPGDDFEDSQPRKLLRGESPLKGAAGRRMDQQKRQNLNGYPTSSLSQAHPAPPAPLPAQINFLLSIIPKASSYTDTRFDATKMVELIREVHLRPPGSIRPPEAQPPSWQPTYTPHQQTPAALPAFASTQAIGQPQYGGKWHPNFSR
jgi:cleavage stimulation factor subunit 3